MIVFPFFKLFIDLDFNWLAYCGIFLFVLDIYLFILFILDDLALDRLMIYLTVSTIIRLVLDISW